MSNIISIGNGPSAEYVAAQLEALAKQIRSGDITPTTGVVVLDGRQAEKCHVIPLGAIAPRKSESMGLLQFAILSIYGD